MNRLNPEIFRVAKLALHDGFRVSIQERGIGKAGVPVAWAQEAGAIPVPVLPALCQVAVTDLRVQSAIAIVASIGFFVNDALSVGVVAFANA